MCIFNISTYQLASGEWLGINNHINWAKATGLTKDEMLINLGQVTADLLEEPRVKFILSEKDVPEDQSVVGIWLGDPRKFCIV